MHIYYQVLAEVNTDTPSKNVDQSPGHTDLSHPLTPNMDSTATVMSTLGKKNTIYVQTYLHVCTVCEIKREYCMYKTANTHRCNNYCVSYMYMCMHTHPPTYINNRTRTHMHMLTQNTIVMKCYSQNSKLKHAVMLHCHENVRHNTYVINFFFRLYCFFSFPFVSPFVNNHICTNVICFPQLTDP